VIAMPDISFHALMRFMVVQKPGGAMGNAADIHTFLPLPKRPKEKPRTWQAMLVGHGAALYVGRLKGTERETFTLLGAESPCRASGGRVAIGYQRGGAGAIVPAFEALDLEGCSPTAFLAVKEPVGSSVFHEATRASDQKDYDAANALVARLGATAFAGCAVVEGSARPYRIAAKKLDVIRVKGPDVEDAGEKCACHVFRFADASIVHCGAGDAEPVGAFDFDGRTFHVLGHSLMATAVVEREGRALRDRMSPLLDPLFP
jgi:hypothetical protein